MEQFVGGVIAMASWVVGLFFFRFWRETRDRLFGIFGLAFWLLGSVRVGLAWSGEVREGRTGYYVLRLIAYLLIIFAIADKNRFWARSPAPPPRPGEGPAGPDAR
jgi:hypothetical protein